MAGVLLDSSFSDNFSLGEEEKLIPKSLEGRIIKYKIRESYTNGSDRAVEEIVGFFHKHANTGFTNIKEAQSKHLGILARFFLDQFFGKISQRGISVAYFEKEPDYLLHEEGCPYIYHFVDDGRTIYAHREEKKKEEEIKDGEEKESVNRLTEIPRLVEIRKGSLRQLVICDPKPSRAQELKYNKKIESIQPLLVGKDDYLLSYMVVNTSDVFRESLSRKKVIYFLNHRPANLPANINPANLHPVNLYLVYSITSVELKSLSDYILKKIKND